MRRLAHHVDEISKRELKITRKNVYHVLLSGQNFLSNTLKLFTFIVFTLVCIICSLAMVKSISEDVCGLHANVTRFYTRDSSTHRFRYPREVGSRPLRHWEQLYWRMQQYEWIGKEVIREARHTKAHLGAGAIAQLIKCLSCKHEGLGLILEPTRHKLKIPVVGRQRQEILGLLNQPAEPTCQVPMRDPVSKETANGT